MELNTIIPYTKFGIRNELKSRKDADYYIVYLWRCLGENIYLYKEQYGRLYVDS